MNVYDFDGTIYKKDSSVELYKYIAMKNPLIIFACLPKQITAILKYKFKHISKEQMKEVYFSFLKYVKDENVIDDFVEKEMANINHWYFEKHKDDDVIISASPEFLVSRFASKLNVNYVIASKVDIRSGKFLSDNCHDEAKVSMFKSSFPDAEIDEFYSDSKSDIYMARLAKSAYFVKNGDPSAWRI